MPLDPRLSLAASLSRAARQALLADVHSRLVHSLGSAVWTVGDLDAVGPVGRALGAAGEGEKERGKTAAQAAPAAVGGVPPALRRQLVASLLAACLSEQPLPTKLVRVNVAGSP